MYIMYISKGFNDEQYAKINTIDEIQNIKNLVSYEEIKNKTVIKKLEKNKKDYGYYFV